MVKGMITILFWNTGGNKVTRIVGNLATIHEVDILVLAESRSSVAELLAELNTTRNLSYHAVSSLCNRIAILARYPEEFTRALSESPHFTIRYIDLPGVEEFLLVAAHLKSKLYQMSESQSFVCSELIQQIRGAENHVGTEKTLLVGDLNMDPFQYGVVAAGGLHGVMTQRVADKGTRKVDGKEYPFFYNPMWSFLGDLSQGPPGTYYYDASEHVNYYWHMFDQVLIRPALLKHFDTERLKILTDDGETDFLSTKEIPDKKRVSDHLPILCCLNL